jgi:hypothetical protein
LMVQKPRTACSVARINFQLTPIIRMRSPAQRAAS